MVKGKVTKENKTKTKKIRDERRPKRPKNSYFMFSTSNHREARLHFKRLFKEANPNLKPEEYDKYKTKVSDIGKYLGNKWRSMSLEEKQKYETMAQEAKSQYDRDYSNYVKLLATENSKVNADESYHSNPDLNIASGDDTNQNVSVTSQVREEVRTQLSLDNSTTLNKSSV